MKKVVAGFISRASRTLNHAAAVVTRSFFCPCCRKRVPRWQDWSPAYRNVICPNCGSHPRHRLVALHFERVAGTLRNASVLHFAAEKPIHEQIVAVAGEYLSADLRPDGRAYELDRANFLVERVDVQADVTNMPFPQQRFDVVICSHVLEHVDDDRKALREIFRVLKYQGWALLQTPMDRCRAATLERRDIDTPALRERFYWQEDHVRLYGREIFARFLDAGFLPTIIPPQALCADPAFYGLWPDEDLMIVRKVWTYPDDWLEDERLAIKTARSATAATSKAA